MREGITMPVKAARTSASVMIENFCMWSSFARKQKTPRERSRGVCRKHRVKLKMKTKIKVFIYLTHRVRRDSAPACFVLSRNQFRFVLIRQCSRSHSIQESHPRGLSCVCAIYPTESCLVRSTPMPRRF